MQGSRHGRWLRSALLIGLVIPMLAHPSLASGEPSTNGDRGLGNHSGGTRFFTAAPNPGALKQISELKKAGDLENASLIKSMIKQPQAEWFTGGTSRAVEKNVRNTMSLAHRQRAVAVLVAYNIPFRDCAQFSAGGATNRAEYLAWIDGFAKGIGRREAVVILEPDGSASFLSTQISTATWSGASHPRPIPLRPRVIASSC